MKITMTAAEAVERARLLLGFDHTRQDGSSGQVNGTNVNVLLERTLRMWYLELLERGELRHIVPAPVEGLLVQADHSPAAATVLRAPSSCRRLLSVRLPGWERSAEVLPPEELPHMVSRQLNPFTAAVADAPIAVLTLGRNTVACWPPAVGAGNPAATGAIDTGPESYVVDDSALLTLKPFLNKYFKVNS